MSVNPRKFKRKKHNLAELKEKIELETDYIYLKSLKMELKHSRKQEKLQKIIHKRTNWRDYTC